MSEKSIVNGASGSEGSLKASKKLAVIYFCFSAFTALFGSVYSAFGHGIVSYPMLLAFLYPLIMGFIPALILTLTKKGLVPCMLSRYLWHSAVACLTVGSVFRGVLDIFGSHLSPYPPAYRVAGIVFLVASVIAGFALKNKKE